MNGPMSKDQYFSRKSQFCQLTVKILKYRAPFLSNDHVSSYRGYRNNKVMRPSYLCMMEIPVPLRHHFIEIVPWYIYYHNDKFIYWLSPEIVSNPQFHFCYLMGMFNSFPPGQNGRHFADDIFRCIFVNEKICIWLKFHWSLFLRLQLTINQHWFR